MIQKIIWQTWRGFNEDHLYENASALSYYTILSIVPVFAVLFGFAKGFGFETILEQQLTEALENQKEVLEQVIRYSQKLLEQSKGGLIAGVGILLLFWTFIGLIGSFEKSLNEIWQVKRSRSYVRRISDFLTIILCLPFLLIVTSSLTLFLTGEIVHKQEGFLLTISPYILFLLRLTPFFLSFAVFSFMYIVVPNTHVPVKAGLIAGFITSVIFHLVQWAYIYFQIGISSYGAVYGSFAAVPLFLIWLQISWLITLAGAELSYRIAYDLGLEQTPLPGSLSLTYQEAVAWVAYQNFKNFSKEAGGLSLKELAKNYALPLSSLRDISERLVQNNILIEAKSEKAPYVFVPSGHMDTITIKSLLDAANPGRRNYFICKKTDELVRFKEKIQQFDQDCIEIPTNLKIKDV